MKKIRAHLNRNAELVSRVVEGKEQEGEKFKDYFNHNEPLSKVPSHRALAMLRGRNEGFLTLAMNATQNKKKVHANRTAKPSLPTIMA